MTCARPSARSFTPGRMTQRVFALALAALLLIDPVSQVGAPTAYAAPAGASRAAGIAPAIEQPEALPAQSAAAKAIELAALPLSFVPNAGQIDRRVRFTARSMGGTLFFAADAVALALPAPSTTPVEAGQRVAPQWTTTRLRFVGANPRPVLRADAPLPGTVNYFFGNDPTRWHTNLPTYAGVVYEQLYPGVDLRYDGAAGRMKGTYTLAPNADPAQIRWRYSGAAQVAIDGGSGTIQIMLDLQKRRAGSLASRAGDAAAEPVLTEQAPLAWQTVGGRQVPVAVRYILEPDGAIGFGLGAYDRGKPLTIDPTLDYSTYLGGGGADRGTGIAADAAGNAYLVGETSSASFPTASALDGQLGGGYDAFITRFNPDGTVGYSTYLGGSGFDYGGAVALGGDGSVYLTGTTFSNDFPTVNPADISYCTFSSCSNAFVAKLNSAGNALEYSTRLGGTDNDTSADALAVDSAGRAYITGNTAASANFPLKNELDATRNYYDAFVTVLTPAGNDYVFSTYLGGGSSEWGQDIAVDSSRNIYVVGFTESGDFPTTNGVLDRSLSGTRDAFVMKYTFNGTAYNAGFGTYLGGSNYEDGVGIAVDSDQNVYVTGPTTSTDFLTQTPLQPTCSGGCAQTDVYVTKLNPTATALLYSTFLGGTGNDSGSAIAVDASGRMVVVGTTYSQDFPTARAEQATCGDPTCASGDAFVAVLAADGRTLETSTYLGGASYDYGYDVAVGPADAVYVTGATTSTNFPTARPYQGTNNGGSSDAFVARLNINPGPISVAITDAQGNAVRKLRTNADGWPALNDDVPASAAEAITVTVTVRNTTATPYAPTFRLSLGSAGALARFYVITKPPPQICNAPAEVFSSTAFQNICREAAVTQPGAARTYEWKVWIQPSKAATLQFKGDLIGAGGVVTDTDLEQVQIPQAAVHPVALLHGILGSMIPEDLLVTDQDTMEHRLDPFLGVYWPLMNNLQKMGYEWNTSLFAVNYNWRQSNARSAKWLRTALGQIRGRTVPEYIVKDQADLVVHSMGGLVSRAYIEGLTEGGLSYNNDVRKIVFIASPHKGFPFDYQTWEGMTWDRYMDNAPAWGGGQLIGPVNAVRHLLNNLLWPQLVIKRYAPSYDELVQSGCAVSIPNTLPSEQRYAYYVVNHPTTGIPVPFYCNALVYGNFAHDPNPDRGVRSLYEMLPAEDGRFVSPYLAASGTVYPYNYEQNQFLQSLNDPANVAKLISELGNPGLTDNIYVLYGDNFVTDTQYEVGPPSGSLWRHGTPQGVPVNPAVGDDLIPADSTKLGRSRDGTPNLLPNLLPENEQPLSDDTGAARHKNIVYYDPTQRTWIPRFLGAIAAPAILPFTTQYQPPNALLNLGTTAAVFIASCPINLLITDPQGRRLGYDPATGQVVREIPNAIYTAPGVEPQLVLIPNPVTGNYQVKTTGYGTGPVGFMASSLNASGTTPIAAYSGQTTPGQVDTYTVTYDPNAPTATPTRTSTATATATRTGTATASATRTGTPTKTGTATRTNTAGAATNTATRTNTAGAVTNTATRTSTATTPSGGTRIRTMTFADNRLVDPISGADSIQGSTANVQLETASPLKGLYAARIPNVASSYLRDDFPPVDTLYAAFYLRLNAIPATSVQIASIANSGTRVGNIQLTKDGTLRLRNDSTQVGSETAALTVGTLYRVGLRQSKGSGSTGRLEAYLAEGDAPFGPSFAASASEPIATQASQFNIGATVSSILVDIVFDDVTLDSGQMPPPSPSGGTPTVTPTASPTPAVSATATRTPTASATASSTATATATGATPATPTPTPTRTATAAASATATATRTPTATSSGSGTLFYALDGTTGGFIEAETFTTRVGTNFLAVSEVGRSNNQYIHTPDGSGATLTSDYMTYELEVTNGGSFALWLLSTGPNGSSDSFWVNVDGSSDVQLVTGANGAWEWKKLSGTLTLPNGRHTLTLKAREDGARADKLFLTKGSTTPSGIADPTMPPQYR